MKKVCILLILSVFSVSLVTGQTNLATNGANALASDEITGGEAAMAFDGDTATGWVVTSSPVQWIRYDLGSPVIVDGYAMHFLADSAPKFQPVTWTFEGSNNDADWTILHEITDNTIFAEWEEFITTNTTAYQYYRLNITEAGGDTLAIGELQLYLIEEPSVATGYANYVEAEMASCGGTVLKTGGSPVLQRGICYNTTGNPTLVDSYRTSSAGIGSYNTTLNNLSPNTTYYFRAFATNVIGTRYADAVRTFTTLKLDQTISFDPIPDHTYGDADFDPAATASSGLAVEYTSSNLSVATIVLNEIHIVGTGSSLITATQAGNASYNAAPSVEQSLTVNKRELQVIADDQSRVYGEPNAAFTLDYSGFVNGDDAGDLDTEPTAECDAAAQSDAGSYFITPSGGSDNHYSFEYIAGYLTVTKAPLDITVDDAERIYGDENPEFNWIYSGFVNDDDESDLDALPEGTTPAGPESDAGSYPISVAGGGDNNYEFVINEGILQVLKAELSGSPDDQAKIYGEPNPEFTYTFTGFRNEDNAGDLDTVPEVVTTADETSPVGTYILSMIPYQDGNYTISYTDDTLTIEKALLNVTVEDVIRYEGESNPEFTLLYSGFVNNNTEEDVDELPVVSCDADESSPAGNYTIEVSGGSDDNYNLLTSDGLLIVQEEPDAIRNQNQMEFSTYPNPVRERLYLRGNITGCTISLVSITGSVMLNRELDTESVDLSHLPDGLYLLTLSRDQKVIFRERIVKD
jgi:hypothetical protein